MVVGGGGVGGRKRVVIFNNFISYILVTNSQMFPLILIMFIYVFFLQTKHFDE